MSKGALLYGLGSLGLGIGLFFGLWIFVGFDAVLLIDRLHHGSWTYMICVLGLSFLLIICGAAKWKIMARVECGLEAQTYSFFLRHYLWQNWLGNFVPPSLAIVMGRAVAHRKTSGVKSGFVSGFWDQAIEFALILALVPVSVAFLAGTLKSGEFLWLASASLGLGGVGVSVIGASMKTSLRSVSCPVVALSVCRVVLTILRLVAGTLALGAALPLLSVMAATAPVALLALVPLTPGNLGLSEWGWLGVLAWAGESPAEAGVLAIGFRVLILVVQTILVGLYECFCLLRRDCPAV